MKGLVEAIMEVDSEPLRGALMSGYCAIMEAGMFSIREATREEFDHIEDIIREQQIAEYYADAPEEEREEFRRSCMAEQDKVWNCHLHAYTHDGQQMLVTVPNSDGSAYIYLAYNPPSLRGTGIATTTMLKCIKDHPQGLSLHTNKDNRVVRGICAHFGFKEYPTKAKDEVFMANKPGIGGEEWWEE